MEKYKSLILATITLTVGIIVSTFIVGRAIKNRNNSEQVVTVTGMAERNFESDLIVWKSSLSVKNMNLTNSYTELKKQTEATQDFLMKKGVKQDEITISAVEINKSYRYIYQDNMNSQIFDGYLLTQNISITSNDVDRIEKISRQITELINDGIEVNSYSPKYYYTKLSDLKIEMLADAAKDAYNRAKTIAENGKGKIGKLKKSSMGVFQIIATNSTEDYSWGGTYNTSSKKKTATITVKSQYLSE